MRKLIWFLILLLVFGCKTTEKSVKDKAVTQTETKVDKSSVQSTEAKATDKSIVAEEAKVKKTIEEIEKSTEEYEARLVVYDTDKPVDEKTGKPPTKSELFITNKKASGSTAKKSEVGTNTIVSNSDIKMSQEATIKINSDSLTNINEKKQSLTTDKTVSNKSWILFVVIGVVLFYLIITKFSFVKLVVKIRKFISAFFK